MGYVYSGVFIVLLICSSVSAYERLLKPCKTTDMNCLTNSCSEFLNKTSKGIGAPYNIAPFDPLELPPIDFPGIADPVTMIHMKNIKVKGLKDMVLGEFNMDSIENISKFNATIVYRITMDVTIDTVDKGNAFSGAAETTIRTAIHVEYPFGTEKDENGELHLVIHPETSTCEPLETPVITLSSELKDNLEKDPDIKAMRETHKNEIIEAIRRFACKISDMSFPTVMETFRKCSKVMTMNDYFLDFKE